MNLLQFDQTNCRTRGKRKEPILAMTYNGQFRVSKNAVELIGLKKGDQVVLSQDKDHPKEWYICIVDKALNVGFQVNFPVKMKMVQFSSSVVTQRIAASFGMDINKLKTIALKVHANPVKMQGKNYFKLTFAGTVEK